MSRHHANQTSSKFMLASSLLMIVLVLSPTAVSSFSLTGDFITGFESGIFLRSNPKMLEDYGCPDAQNNN